jgi:hypothetical protein
MMGSGSIHPMEAQSAMNRRQLLTSLAVIPAATQLSAQPAPKVHVRSGLVAYSYRKELAGESMSYEGLIARVADWGLDGLDCTVYWNAGVRVRLSQPTAELQRAELENIKKWVDVTDRIGASHMRVFGGNIPAGATE